MAVLMATGHSVQIPHSVFDPVRTLTATIAAELGETVQGGMHYRVLFVIGTLLMLISLIINVTADLIVRGAKGRQNTDRGSVHGRPNRTPESGWLNGWST